MRVRVKLLGLLREQTPPGGELQLSDNTTLQDALRVLAISPDQIQAIAINGRIERDLLRPLVDADEVLILPPVSGG